MAASFAVKRICRPHAAAGVADYAQSFSLGLSHQACNVQAAQRVSSSTKGVNMLGRLWSSPLLHAHAGQRELQVLDYQNVAHTLIGLTASAYACWFMGQEMQARYQK